MTTLLTEEWLWKQLNTISFQPEFKERHGGCPPAYKGGRLTNVEQVQQAILTAHKASVEEATTALIELVWSTADALKRNGDTKAAELILTKLENIVKDTRKAGER